MPVALTEPEFNPRRWDKITSLLSMDVVRPFYDLMGLRSSEPDVLQQVLRQEIIAGRKRFAAQPDVDAPIDLQTVLDTVSEALGAQFGEYLTLWATYVFHDAPADNRNLARWSAVLQACRGEPNLWARLGFPDDSLDRFRQSKNTTEYRRRQEEVDAQPLTDWDLHQYVVKLYDDILYGESAGQVPDGPRLWVLPTVKNFQGYRFWLWLLKGLGADQRDRLWQEGLQIVEEEDLYAPDLPHPSVLEIRR